MALGKVRQQNLVWGRNMKEQVSIWVTEATWIDGWEAGFFSHMSLCAFLEQKSCRNRHNGFMARWGKQTLLHQEKKSVGGTCIHQAEWLHQIFLKLKLQINIQSHKKQTVCGISAELYQYIFSNFYRSVLTHIKAEQILNKVSMSPGVHETNVQISSSMLKPKLIKSLKKAFCFKE